VCIPGALGRVTFAGVAYVTFPHRNRYFSAFSLHLLKFACMFAGFCIHSYFFPPPAILCHDRTGLCVCVCVCVCESKNANESRIPRSGLHERHFNADFVQCITIFFLSQLSLSSCCFVCLAYAHTQTSPAALFGVTRHISPFVTGAFTRSLITCVQLKQKTKCLHTHSFLLPLVDRVFRIKEHCVGRNTSLWEKRYCILFGCMGF
jgi:hypothetical protein